MRFGRVPIILICSLASGLAAANSSDATVFPAETSEVEFTSEDLALAATLYLPERTEPVPGVVLVHGSGPHSRKAPLAGQLNMQFGFTIQVFEELALGLQRAGIAVLVYDKRSCFSQNGCGDNGYPAPRSTITVGDFIGDAANAVKFLAAREGVDSSRVFVAGHSQGGQLIPEILSLLQDPAGGIIVAGNIGSVDELLRLQSDLTRKMLAETGMGREQIETTVTAIDEMANTVASVRTGSHDGSPISGASPEFWLSWIRAAEAIRSRVESLDAPLLVLGGGYDWNVPPSELDRWRELFGSLSNHRSRSVVKSLPCVTHALNCVSQPDWQTILPEDIGRTVDSRVIDEMSRFILADRPST